VIFIATSYAQKETTMNNVCRRDLLMNYPDTIGEPKNCTISHWPQM
jgi:hypothetical protein